MKTIPRTGIPDGNVKMKRQSWFERNFGWIRQDFRRLLFQLRQPETWVVIGMLTAFGLIVFFVFRLALRSDNLLRSLHPGTVICRAPGEKSIAFVFASGFFFALFALASLGEFILFIDNKRRRFDYGAKQALKWSAGWGMAALAIGATAFFLLDRFCR